ncbi:Ig-like domain-containing protein [Sporosarcina sp. E16_3]|uniref:Ig-like domain-containing protein n=1 Tax=Sporosarcina sp. E16_3 TaxID=2789293 RepID=UPI001A929802|nr:Ig-like domain-containing protein [Sporosarcina sp. E16_3]MBO0600619.1 Ig-like domain-containing protein [Sporosarcina sp. E16_3]
MKRDVTLLASSINPSLSVPEIECSFAYAGQRRINFNDEWRFQRETNESIVSVPNPKFDDSSWRQLNLPHDWSIELEFNPNSPATHEAGYLDGGIGWYRKTFTIPLSMEGKKVFIDFDGVYMDSTAYLNGELLGIYPFGYNAFSYDITDKLHKDGRENVLVIKVNNKQPSSRWYSGSGIFRNVYLTVTSPIYVARYGVFVTTPDLCTAYELGNAMVNIKTKINNESGSANSVIVKSTIYDTNRKFISTVCSAEKIAAEDKSTHFEENIVINYPELWSTENPYRYILVTEVLVDGKVEDTYENQFGIRYFDFDANEGFSLNGQYMKLHGVCMHHDLGALGSATNARAIERQLKIMKDMGVNSIRVTHNPASPELLEVANNLGLLVVDEAFDSWGQGKKTYDYSRFFSSWAEHDIKEMVDRGKNEPCIIMWSIGNEIYDTTTESGVAIARNLVRWVKEIDTTRPTTIGEDKTRADKVNVTPINKHIKEIFDTVDIVGLNYSENNYAGYHEQNPNWKIYGAETSSATRSRGVYTHPYDYNLSTQYEDLQQSSYDNDYVGWGRTAEDAWKYDRDLKHIAGQYIWTGFDYIGEPTPYYNAFPAKSSYFGAVDTAGFPKDIYYYYQSQWKDEPMVHILPHWNWGKDETVRVIAYTNAYKVELILNGISLGERSYVVKKTLWGSTYKETVAGDTYLEWSVPFEPGVLTAVGKDENNHVIAIDHVITAGDPAGVRLTADRRVLSADGKNLSFITVDIVDSVGNIVPTADNLVQFSISGNGELVGVDNGNAASIERFKDSKRQAFSGKALAIVQSSKIAGIITLNASGAGVIGDSIRLFTVSAVDEGKKSVAGVDMIYSVVDMDNGIDLPSRIKVFYCDSSIEIRNVIWDEIDPMLCATVGKFSVEGSIEGITIKANALVTVREIVAIKSYATASKIGICPELPSEITLVYSDGTTSTAHVVWDIIPNEELDRVGVFIVDGHVTETDLKAKAYIRITNESDIGGIADLSMISVNGEALENFNAATHYYELLLPYGSKLPKVKAVGLANASVTILPAYTFADIWKVFVTSEDGLVSSEYSIQMITEEPKLQSLVLGADRHVIIQDDVMGLKITGQLENNEVVDFTSGKPIYKFDNKIIKIDNNRLYALEEGQVNITATITHNGLSVTTPKLNITIEKNLTKKSIVRLEVVSVIASKGEELFLPETISAQYNNGISRDVTVTWESIDPMKMEELGDFIIIGGVGGTTMKAIAEVTVKGVVAIKNITKGVLRNQLPELPNELEVYYSDGTEGLLKVKWEEIPLDRIDIEGIFDLEGSVETTQIKAKAQIRVTDEVGGEQNISRAKNGYDYPKAEASYTNKESNSKDRIEAINDDLISYANEPHNRWTNWQEKHRTNDWVSVTFGDYEPVDYYLDNIELHWYADNRSSHPDSIKIQYNSGGIWLDVLDLQSNPSAMTLCKANVHTFKPVRTSAIRIDMTAQTGMAIALTELKIQTKWPKLYTEPKISTIKVGDKNILEDFVQRNGNYEFEVELGVFEEMPEITATGEDNTGITIVPTVTVPSTAKVLVESEDGKKTRVYTIHFIFDK